VIVPEPNPPFTCAENPFLQGCPPVVSPPPPATPGPCADSGQVLDFDALYQAVRADLARADADDASHFRYLTIANRFDAGSCDDAALDVDRQAIAKFVNMISTRPVLTEPEPIDAQRLIYRIDLRDYDLDRAIAVDGVSFADGWEAILASNPYAVSFVGADANAAKRAALTDIPVMFADSVIATAGVGNLYYALIGIDVTQSADDFILEQLGIDLEQNVLDEEQIRAVTTRSGVSTGDLLVQRDDIQIRAGMLWEELEFARTPSSDPLDSPLIQDPLALREGARALIYSQPNGLFAFAVADESGVFIEQDENLLDVRHERSPASPAISCSSCHSAGIFPVGDEARDLVLANARSLGLTRDEVEQLQGIYISSQEFARLVSEDSQAFYQRALQLLDLPITGPDPVGAVYDRFEADLTLPDFAGDLGVTPATLRLDLALLQPALEPLRSGSLRRADVTPFYVDALCTLSVVLENAPAQEVCDAAAAAVAELGGPIPIAVTH